MSIATGKQRKIRNMPGEDIALHVYQEDGSGACLQCGQGPNGIAHPSDNGPKGQLYEFVKYIANESGARTSVTRWFLPVDADPLNYPPGQSPLPDPHTWYIDTEGFEFQVVTDDEYNITAWHMPRSADDGARTYPVNFLLAVIDWLTAIINKGRESDNGSDS